MNGDGESDVPDEFKTVADLFISGSYHNCMSKPNLVVCSGYNGDGQTNIPLDFQEGADHIAAGHIIPVCRSNLNCFVGVMMDKVKLVYLTIYLKELTFWQQVENRVVHIKMMINIVGVNYKINYHLLGMNGRM